MNHNPKVEKIPGRKRSSYILMIFPLLSFLLLAAHLLRRGYGLAGLTLVIIGTTLLCIPRWWSGWILQALLAAACLVWIRTFFLLSSMRMAAGESWSRLAIILGSVILWTLISLVLFWTRGFRQRFS
ncbi:MAG TPA: hypothetical protein PK014_08065 [Thermoanaerobaculia bacterium]|nr:hypothetical protein [Thermoanaerobaculia bacterium]HUM30216.1 hypothetical protein [Thermoanaerobaculia bacterium]HXK68335.1 hypothetical protein [Thermoanaerobaculia bacterium]